MSKHNEHSEGEEDEEDLEPYEQDEEDEDDEGTLGEEEDIFLFLNFKERFACLAFFLFDYVQVMEIKRIQMMNSLLLKENKISPLRN